MKSKKFSISPAITQEFQDKMKELENEVIRDCGSIVGGSSAPGYSKVHVSGGFEKSIGVIEA